MILNSATQLIRLTLLDGDPEGLRSVGAAGRTTVLMGCPWSRLKTLLSRSEAQRPAVYFMTGTAIEPDQEFDEVVYIGECDSLADRFKQHHKQDSADWAQIFVATTTESTFNKAHARLAEHLLVERARASKRARVLTINTSPGDVDEGDRAFTQEFVLNVVTLAQTLGVLLFRPTLESRTGSQAVGASGSDETPPVGASIQNEFYFQYTTEKISARMVTDGKDFVILKGSKARPDGVGIPARIKELRSVARSTGVLVKEPGDVFETFKDNFATTSSSAAGSMVYGSACSGPSAWHHVATNQAYRVWVADNSN